MAAIITLPTSDGAVVHSEQLFQARRDAAGPAAVLAHATGDRFRIRLEGRQADLFLQLAASEIASSQDLLKIRINRASSSLTLWVRAGSELEGDGERVTALVSEAVRRIALGQRSRPVPIETAQNDGLGLCLSLLQAVAL